jgi:hypothetical protein
MITPMTEEPSGRCSGVMKMKKFLATAAVLVALTVPSAAQVKDDAFIFSSNSVVSVLDARQSAFALVGLLDGIRRQSLFELSDADAGYRFTWIIW